MIAGGRCGASDKETLVEVGRLVVWTLIMKGMP